ncbi:MAG: hypothetical protein Q8912_14205, partial [Bacillota bacterium]|nr:hypothetical protein [Bacillota bacterium]
MGMFARFFGKTPYNQAKRQEALTDRASQNSDGTWSLVSQCPGSGNDCGVYQKENSYELADLLKLFLIEENSRGDTQMWTVGAQKAPDNYIVWKTYGVEEERNKFHGHR